MTVLVRSYIVTGLSGSGKTTARRYAERCGYATVSLGDVVRRAYEDRGGDESTAAFVLRTHETAGRAQFAREAVATLDERLAGDDTPTGVVVEGVHSTAAASVVRERFGDTPIVWIQAPQSLRLRRLCRRDNGHSTRALFRRDLRELDSGLADIASPLGHDRHVRNDHTQETFERRLDAVFDH